MKRGMALFIIICIIIASVGCQAQEPTPVAAGDDGVGSTYKIGFLAAVTGGASSLGEPEHDVALMLQEQYDAQGGIVGVDGVRHPVEIVIYDTEGSGNVGVTVAKKLIDSDKVIAIVGPTVSTVAMALIPIAQEAEIPMVAMASSSAIVSPVAEREWVFKVAQSNEHTAPWQVRYAKAKGLTKIANLYVNNAYGEDGAQAIRDTAAAEGLSIVLEETFDAADTDMTAQITKIKASDAEAVLVTAIPPAAAILTKQYRELGVDLPLIHNSGVAMKAFIDLSGAANAEGVVFPIGKVIAADSLADDDPQKPVIVDFLADYESFVGKAPSHFAAHAWDSIKIVEQGLKQLPEGASLEDQRSQVRSSIESLSGFVGVDGIFHLSAEDHVGLSPDDVVLARISDGDWQYYPQEEW